MKILITHELFPPDVVGGGETLTYKIAKELIERGFQVKVLTSGDPKIKYYENIETIRIPINRYLMNLSYPIIKKYAKVSDLIQTSSGNMCFPSFLAARSTKKPICCYIHHIFGYNWVYVRGPILGKVFQIAENFFLTRDYDAVIFQNDLSLNIGKSLGIKSKTFIVHPGIDAENYYLNIERKNQVLFVGSLSMDKGLVKIKGLDVFLEAAKMLPNVKFLIAGGSDYLEKIKLPKNVVFLKAKNKQELIKLYNESLICCKTSLAEGFGLSLLEAMAGGCAIVSTIDIGQKGILVKPRDVLALTKAIKYYIENPEKARKDGEENRKIAKKFTWKKYIDDLIKIYEYITSK
ncbi:MAG: glycosyltransferase family 4 protein [Candidatus Aenigmarchaeota archaeon]|nr:glycosyltransferase family 4 protein [Candidatus Aenigmarchaeota archaeon]